MRAAIVNSIGATPVFGQIATPEPRDGEVLLRVKAAALSNLVRAQAAGKHYSSWPLFPFVPGNDGVGVTDEGERVYFISPRMPFGSMAEYTVVDRSLTIAIPKSLGDEQAAAMGNPGLATWGSLLGRAKLQPGEVVLINGATGVAGRQAVQVAKYLGASRVIATGRNATSLNELKSLGADEVISLSSPDLPEMLRTALTDTQVILDYLWGPSAIALLEAAAGHGNLQGKPRIRFIQIGSMSGTSIPLSAQLLRSSGIELLGSGLGSLSSESIMDALRRMFAATEEANFSIGVEALPLSAVEDAWTKNSGDRRIVIMPSVRS